MASTGGGRTYRSQRPTTYYAILVVIVLLGTLSVVLARHNYQSGASSSSTRVPPLAGTTSYAALGFDVCGKVLPSLPAATSTAAALEIQADGVVKVSPTTAATAGNNANVARLAAGYPGLTITSSSLKIPATSTTSAVSYSNGDVCAAGTPEAGKSGVVSVTYWPNFASKAPTVSSDLASVRLTANSLVTVAFIPQGTTASKPSSTTINKMLVASQNGSTTPTTAPATSATTVPVATTTPTSAPTTTTTTKK